MAIWYKPQSSFYKQFVVPLLKLPIKAIEGVNILFSENKPVYSKSKFKWTGILEENHKIILAELQGVMKERGKIPLFTDLSEEQKQITTENDWQVYLLIAYGREIPQNASKCVATVALLKNITGIQSAMFSVIKPGTIIKPHRGPFNGLLRYHLGLIIPADYSQCCIKIADQTYQWQTGSSLVFDDSFEHEVWNNTAEDRVVLFVDFERPLPFPVSLLNKLMIGAIGNSPFINSIISKANAAAM